MYVLDKIRGTGYPHNTIRSVNGRREGFGPSSVGSTPTFGTIEMWRNW